MAAKLIFVTIALGMMGLYDVGAHYQHKTRWRTLGCYKDMPEDRALKYSLGFVDNFYGSSHMFEECRKKAENQALDYFGIKDTGECWGSDDISAYDKHGCSENCVRNYDQYGVGLSGSNFVYYNMPELSPCKCGETKQYRLALERDSRPNCPLYNMKVYRSSHSAIRCSTKTETCPGYKLDGGWSRFGAWSACDQLCGHNGKQKSIRTCNDPKPANGGSDCIGNPQITRSCSTRNCPRPCGFDGVLLQLLNSFNLNISISNHMIDAFLQVMETKDIAGSKPSASKLSKNFLIKKIKSLLGDNFYRKVRHARTLLGVLLAQQKDCFYEDVAKELKDDIGDEGFKRLINADGKVTLSFVINISEKMTSAIHEATAIAKNIAEYKHLSNVDYILSAFTEAKRRKVMVPTTDVQTFNNLTTFTQALDNLTGLVGKGGGCREPTYAGIIKGITQGHPRQGSPMYVFTNAPPKKYGELTKNSAIYLAQKNKISLNFIMPRPFCGLRARYYYMPIAKATGGFSLGFKSGSSMIKLRGMIESSLVGTSSVASGRVNKKHKHKRKIHKHMNEGTFDIDDIANDGTIEIEAECPSAQRIELLNPNRVVEHHEKTFDKSLFWTIVRPMKGKWRFISDTKNLRFEVKSQAKLDITFKFRFMRGNANLDHPLIGEKAKVKVVIPNTSRLLKKTLSLVDDWKLLSNEDNSYIYESMSPLTSKNFSLAVRGKTLSGFDFTRESVIIQPKIAAITSQMDPWFSPDADEKFLYKASIIYTGTTPRKFSIKVRASSEDTDDGEGDSYDRMINNGRNIVSVKLTAPSRGALTVKITIESGDVEINFQDGPFEVWD